RAELDGPSLRASRQRGFRRRLHGREAALLGRDLRSGRGIGERALRERIGLSCGANGGARLFGIGLARLPDFGGRGSFLLGGLTSSLVELFVLGLALGLA